MLSRLPPEVAGRTSPGLAPGALVRTFWESLMSPKQAPLPAFAPRGLFPKITTLFLGDGSDFPSYSHMLDDPALRHPALRVGSRREVVETRCSGLGRLVVDQAQTG